MAVANNVTSEKFIIICYPELTKGTKLSQQKERKKTFECAWQALRLPYKTNLYKVTCENVYC